MTPRIINGFTVYAYSTPQSEDEFPRAFIETRKAGPLAEGEEEPEPQTFEIFTQRRFRNGIEAMSAARNVLAAVKTVDQDGVPDPLPE